MRLNQHLLHILRIWDTWGSSNHILICRTHNPVAAEMASKNLPACRLARIREISGQGGQQDAALHALLEGDFDPEDYDQRMTAAFGDDYYEVRLYAVHAA